VFRFHDESDKPVSTWADQYRSGRSLKEIADQSSCSISTVRRSLLAAGVVLRTTVEAAVFSTPKIVAKTRGRKSPRTPEWNRKLAEARRAVPVTGVRFTSQGYIEYTVGPNKGRRVHTVAVEESIGRRLRPDEVVHHIDGDRFNNDLSNLRLMTRAAHASLHRRERL